MQTGYNLLEYFLLIKKMYEQTFKHFLIKTSNKFFELNVSFNFTVFKELNQF